MLMQFGHIGYGVIGYEAGNYQIQQRCAPGTVDGAKKYRAHETFVALCALFCFLSDHRTYCI